MITAERNFVILRLLLLRNFFSTEIVHREVSLSCVFYNSIRSQEEFPTCFSNNYFSLLSRHCIQFRELDSSIYRQFVVVRIPNVKVSNNNRLSLIAKMTTECKTIQSLKNCQLQSFCILVHRQVLNLYQKIFLKHIYYSQVANRF